MADRKLSKTWIRACKEAQKKGDFYAALSILENQMSLSSVSENKAGRLAKRFAAVGGLLQDQIRQERKIHIVHQKIYSGPAELTPEDLVCAADFYARTAGDFMRRFPQAGGRWVADRLEKVDLVATTPIKESLWEIPIPLLEKAF